MYIFVIVYFIVYNTRICVYIKFVYYYDPVFDVNVYVVL